MRRKDEGRFAKWKRARDRNFGENTFYPENIDSTGLDSGPNLFFFLFKL